MERYGLFFLAYVPNIIFTDNLTGPQSQVGCESYLEV